MLTSLSISNYVLINSLHIEFDSAMNVITGETGAGKSIIMGALSLILGNRAETSSLLDKNKKCVVEATFDIAALEIQSFFYENDLDFMDITTVRREITENGKSRAFINDTPVNLAQLKAFSSRLIDIHSQHSNLLFNDEDFRISVVDEFAQIKPQVIDYQMCLALYHAENKTLLQLLERQKENIEKKDYYEFVFQELHDAQLLDNEQEELESKIDFLSHTETIKSNLFQTVQLLSETEGSVLEQLRTLRNLTASISVYRNDLKDISERFDASYIELKDLETEVISINDKVDYSPQLLADLKERLDLINTLQQKYHLSSVADLIAKRDELNELLHDFSTDDERIEKCRNHCEQLRRIAYEKAQQISYLRCACVKDLEQNIVNRIKKLGIADAKFKVEINSANGMHKNGIDDIRFLFSANKGVDLADLEKIASGGEISRLMLAVKATISDKTILPTIVFDEIDVGISGEIAGKVGRAMKEMASNRQLLVITHLPQIAAKGARHYKVYKELEHGKSRTQVQLLDKNGRVKEIAQMISGEQCSDAALITAQELINE